MATLTNKILGKSNPAATTDTDIFTVPTGYQYQLALHISSISGSAKVRVAVGTNGAGSLTNADYIVYDAQIDQDNPKQVTNIYLNAGDKLTVRADTANVSFVAMGLEKQIS